MSRALTDITGPGSADPSAPVLDILPQLRACTHVDFDSKTLLVLAAGFEERRNAIFEAISESNGAAAAILDYLPRVEQNDFDGVMSLLAEHGFNIGESPVLSFDRFGPHSFSQDFTERLVHLRIEKVVLDISSMSKLAILMCLEVLRERNVEVALFYAEARQYRPSESEFDQAWQEKNFYRPSIQIYTGTRKVVRVASLTSVAMQGQPTAAIAFMSFNEELTQILLNTVYPSRLFLVNGRPPDLEWRERATAWIHEQLRREWPQSDNPVDDSSLPLRATSTRYYMETVRELLSLYWDLSADYRLLLAPTGSKMQTVGCFIVRAMHPDIHVEYPTPLGYRDPFSTDRIRERISSSASEELEIVDPYSRGIGAKWTVEFGRLGDLVQSLRLTERELRLSF